MSMISSNSLTGGSGFLQTPGVSAPKTTDSTAVKAAVDLSEEACVLANEDGSNPSSNVVTMLEGFVQPLDTLAKQSMETASEEAASVQNSSNPSSSSAQASDPFQSSLYTPAGTLASGAASGTSGWVAKETPGSVSPLANDPIHQSAAGKLSTYA